MNERIWVTGAGGLIGSNVLKRAVEDPLGCEWIGLTRDDLDLRDHESVRSRFQEESPMGLIHCAAIANTGYCEANAALAFQTNTEVTGMLSGLFAGRSMVFLSTDIVFDGLDGGYAEDSVCRPINVYGRTKRDAEKLVLQEPFHCVLRLSLNGGVSPTRNRGFNEILKRAFEDGDEVSLFEDEYRQPLPVPVTARIILTALRERWSGVFHLGGAERMSRYAIGELLLKRWRIPAARLVPTSLMDFTGGKRAPDTSMDCRKIQSCLDFPIPSLREWLQDHPEASF